jgi:hypothetical protein
MANVEPLWTSRAKAYAATILISLFALAYGIGASGVLAGSTVSAFRPIALTAILPPLLFLAAYAISKRLRQFVLAQDLETLTMLQHWRVLGFAFLLLYAFDRLPALFAWPAGLGDVAVGLLAPIVVMQMAKDPAFVQSWRFLGFHIVGMFDFAIAVATASLASGVLPSFVSNGITSGPMEVWPLNIFPSFFVPIFIILHLAVFLKIADRRPAPGKPPEASVNGSGLFGACRRDRPFAH